MVASNAIDINIYGDKQSDYFKHFWSRTYRQVTDDCGPTVKSHAYTKLSADRRPTVGRLLADGLSTVG